MNGQIKAGEIWWGRMGKTLRLLEEIRGCLLEETSAVLLFPDGLFWEEIFAEKVRAMAGNVSAHRMFKELPDTGEDPGLYCLRELCSKSVRNEYWPGESAARFLAEKKEITFHNNYLLVRNITSQKSLKKWLDFVDEYQKYKDPDGHFAVFLLECRMDAAHTDLPVLSCETGPQDCHIFCLMAAGEALLGASGKMGADSSPDCTAGKTEEERADYLAELAYQAGPGDPEFCALLLRKKEAFLAEPVKTILACAKETGRSDTESKAISAVWKAQVVQLFPRLEQFRFRFISEHEAGLRHHLPIYDGNGEEINDPFDLEFGNLLYLVHLDGARFAPAHWEKIQVCRLARNTLAHNKILTEKDVKRIWEL